jgi:hypothetical protein
LHSSVPADFVKVTAHAAPIVLEAGEPGPAKEKEAVAGNCEPQEDVAAPAASHPGYSSPSDDVEMAAHQSGPAPVPETVADTAVRNAATVLHEATANEQDEEEELEDDPESYEETMAATAVRNAAAVLHEATANEQDEEEELEDDPDYEDLLDDYKKLKKYNDMIMRAMNPVVESWMEMCEPNAADNKERYYSFYRHWIEALHGSDWVKTGHSLDGEMLFAASVLLDPKDYENGSSLAVEFEAKRYREITPEGK